MALIFQDSYQNNSPKPVDNKYGRYVNGVFRAYLNVGEANSLINSAYRYIGLTVLIGDGTNNQEYSYYAGTGDGALVPKASGFNPVSQLSYYIVENYGATGDGTTDDSTAFNAAVAAMPSTGGVLYLGAKAYMINQRVTISKPVSIIGQGAGDPDGFVKGRTRIFCTSATIDVFYTTQGGITFSGFSMFNTAATPTAGSGIRVQSQGFGLRFNDISINGFYDQMFFYDGGEWAMDSCQFMGKNRHLLYVSRQLTPDGGDMCITNSFFFNGGSAGIKYVSGGGLKVTNCKFNAWRGTVGGNFVNVVGDYALDATIDQTTVDFLFSNNSVENYKVSGLKFRVTSPATFANVVINSNQFAPNNNTQPSVDIDGIYNISVQSNVFSRFGSAVAVQVTNGSDVIIANNAVHGFAFPGAIVTSGLTNFSAQSGYSAAGGFPIVGPSGFGGNGREIILANFSPNNFQAQLSILAGQPDAVTGVDIIPKGNVSPLRAFLNLFYSDYSVDQTSYEVLSITAGNGKYSLNSAGVGASSSARNISFQMNGVESLLLDVYGRTQMKNLIFQTIADDNSFILGGIAFDGTNFLRNNITGHGSGIQLVNGEIHFFTVAASGGPGTTAVSQIPLFLSADGKVGILTTTPAFALDVHGAINSDNTIALTRAGSATLGAGAVLAFQDALTPTGAMYIQLNASKGLDFWHYDNSAGSAIAMTISNAGVVTIANTAGSGVGMAVVSASGAISRGNPDSVTTKHLIGNSTAPTIAAGTGAGTSPTIAISGTDMSFTVTLTTGSTPATSAVIATVTFNGAYAAAPRKSMSDGNANASLVRIFSTTTTTTLVLNSNTSALTAATQYIWDFILVQ